jgi:hypothetical protein
MCVLVSVCLWRGGGHVCVCCLAVLQEENGRYQQCPDLFCHSILREITGSTPRPQLSPCPSGLTLPPLDLLGWTSIHNAQTHHDGFHPHVVALDQEDPRALK